MLSHKPPHTSHPHPLFVNVLYACERCSMFSRWGEAMRPCVLKVNAMHLAVFRCLTPKKEEKKSMQKMVNAVGHYTMLSGSCALS